MSEVNYRHEHGCSNKALKYAPKHIRRVGQIRTIEGYRWASRRSYVCEGDGERHYWRNTHERLRIRGENGQVLLDGVCWGYHGQGPRALVDMLVVAGLTKQLAEYVAFNSPRNDSAGVDWKITCHTRI
mgnify:FL=1